MLRRAVAARRFTHTPCYSSCSPPVLLLAVQRRGMARTIRRLKDEHQLELENEVIRAATPEDRKAAKEDLRFYRRNEDWNNKYAHISPWLADFIDSPAGHLLRDSPDGLETVVNFVKLLKEKGLEPQPGKPPTIEDILRAQEDPDIEEAASEVADLVETLGFDVEDFKSVAMLLQPITPYDIGYKPDVKKLFETQEDLAENFELSVDESYDLGFSVRNAQFPTPADFTVKDTSDREFWAKIKEGRDEFDKEGLTEEQIQYMDRRLTEATDEQHPKHKLLTAEEMHAFFNEDKDRRWDPKTLAESNTPWDPQSFSADAFPGSSTVENPELDLERFTKVLERAAPEVQSSSSRSVEAEADPDMSTPENQKIAQDILKRIEEELADIQTQALADSGPIPVLNSRQQALFERIMASDDVAGAFTTEFAKALNSSLSQHDLELKEMEENDAELQAAAVDAAEKDSWDGPEEQSEEQSEEDEDLEPVLDLEQAMLNDGYKEPGATPDALNLEEEYAMMRRIFGEELPDLNLANEEEGFIVSTDNAKVQKDMHVFLREFGSTVMVANEGKKEGDESDGEDMTQEELEEFLQENDVDL
ncbi:hypothetical protein BKA62DRAFT_690681 [Auriculariales sp. MPI-PUGE-AT-0066]|nr:hypothetical protein BKA62DRAFT_690681 [Auriculariales sp. MPI-PUGE-AT-0066]